ncbi:MAG: hypothetical protein IKQ67_08055 [Candidatus Methanomethylophilaceae archaeon]|nr:hypothetical protein [Candidatus Methanomethylophilaceae archaeon]
MAESSYEFKPEEASDKPRVSLKAVLEEVHRQEFRSDNNGEWPYGSPNDLMKQLLNKEQSLFDPHLQANFLDWVESEDYNKFVNTQTGEVIYALSAKRGNKVYATRKTKNRDKVKNSLDGKEFDVPVAGSHDRRMTRLLLVTVNFDRARMTAEEAWASLRSTGIEGIDYEFNVLNKLNANISKIFGKHGTLISKEAQSSGYPAPHLIILLDHPIMVQRHIGRDGKVTWRLCNPRILDRIGKGLIMRKLCRTDYRKAIDQNPIWKHGFIDFEGIVREKGSKSGRDAITYAFKYLVKCLTEDGSASIRDISDINSVKDSGKRTMLFTHLGNKCFRTRDISFGKGFKDRIGLLPDQKSDEPSPWKRIRTLTGYEQDFIIAYNQQVALNKLKKSLKSPQETVT